VSLAAGRAYLLKGRGISWTRGGWGVKRGSEATQPWLHQLLRLKRISFPGEMRVALSAQALDVGRIVEVHSGAEAKGSSELPFGDQLGDALSRDIQDSSGIVCGEHVVHVVFLGGEELLEAISSTLYIGLCYPSSHMT